MFAKRIATVSLVGLFFTSSIFGQGFSKPASKQKPKTTPAGRLKTPAPRANSLKKPKTNSAQHGSFEAVAITDARGVKRVVAETADENGKKSVSLFINSSGDRYRRSQDDPRKWEVFDKSGKQQSDFFGDIELVDGRDIRMTYSTRNQVRVFKLDGTWELQLGSADVQAPGGEPAGIRIDYAVRPKSDVGHLVVDHQDGHIYETHSFDEQDRLTRTRHRETEELSYFDRQGRKVTIKLSEDPRTQGTDTGRRTVAMDTGAGYETDAGGRVIRQFDSNNKAIMEYHYRYTDGRVALNQFRNSEGVWELIEYSNDQEKWCLVGEGAPRVNGVPSVSFAADAVRVNRDNDVVIRDGDKTKLYRIDGSVITVSTSRLSNGGTKRTVSVATNATNTESAYSVTETRMANGKLVSKNLSSKSGFFKTTDGTTWNEYDEAGKVIAKATLVGDVEIVGHPTMRRSVYLPAGMLLKTSFATEPDAKEREPKLRLDEAGQPIYSHFIAIATNGWKHQRFANGVEIVRYPNGNVLYTIDAAGRRHSFNHESDPSGKRSITGLEVIDSKTGRRLSQWKWENIITEGGKQIGYFVNPAGDGSFTKIRVTDSGKTIFEIEKPFRQTVQITHRLDGGTITRTYDGDSITRDRHGRVVRVRRADGLACEFERDVDSGALVRADLPMTTFVIDGYEAADDRPFRQGTARITATSLTLEDAVFPVADGESPRFWLRYRQTRNGRLYLSRRQWPSGAETEHALVDGFARLIRARDSDGREITVQYDERGRAVRADGTSWDFVDASDEQGTRKSKPVRRRRFTVVTPDYRDARGELPEEARVAKSKLAITTSREDGHRVSYDDSSGAQVTLWADGTEECLVDGRLRYAREPQGRETRLTYDEKGRLLSVTSLDLELKQDSDGSVLLARRGDGTTTKLPLAHFAVVRVGAWHAVKAVPQSGAVAVDYLLLARGQVESRLRDGHVRRYKRRATDSDETVEAGQDAWRGRITRETDPESKLFEYFRWEDGTVTRVDMDDGTKQNIDSRGRGTYEKMPDGEERHITYGDGQARRETSSDGWAKNYDNLGRIIYEHTLEGDEIQHFYLDNGHHVARGLAKEARGDGKEAKVVWKTTFEPHPRDKSRERIIVHETQDDRMYFFSYPDEDKNRGERRDKRVAFYIVGNEKRAEGFPVDSLVEFDKFGRMIYRRQANGVAASFYYPKTFADDVPLVVEDQMGKWVRGERLWDGSRNYRWKLEKDGQTRTRTGTFKVSRFRSEAPFKTTAEPKYEFVVLPRTKSMLAEGQGRRDLGNGVTVVRRDGGGDLFEIRQSHDRVIRVMEAAGGPDLPPRVRGVAAIDVGSDGSLEIRYHNGLVERRSRHGRVLRLNVQGVPVAVMTPGGMTFTTEPGGEGNRVDTIQVEEDGIVKVVATEGQGVTTIDQSGNIFRCAGKDDRKQALVAVIGANGGSSLKITRGPGETPRRIQWVTKNTAKHERQVSFRVDARGQWTDGESYYDAAWVDPSTGEFHMLNDRTWRTILPNGNEEETHYKAAVWLPDDPHIRVKRPTTVRRDSSGRTTRSTNELAVTSFVRDRQHQIVSVLEGDVALVKQSDGTWKHSLDQGEKVQAKLKVTRDATQRWIGENGVTRTISRDGVVRIMRPDGSSCTILPSGSQVRQRHGPKSLVDEVVTHKDGLTTVNMKDDSRYAYNPNVRPDKVRHSDGLSAEFLEFSGSIDVSADGAVTITTFPLHRAPRSQAPPASAWQQGIPVGTQAKVFHRNGPASEFTWRPALTGAVWTGDDGLQVDNLNRIGASNPRQTSAGVDAMRHGVVEGSLGRGLEEISLLALPRMAGRLGVSQSWLREQAKAGKLPTTKDGDDYHFNPVAVYDALVERMIAPGPAAKTLARIERLEPADITRLAGSLLKPIDQNSEPRPSNEIGFAGTRWRTYRKSVPTGVITLKADGTVDVPSLPSSMKKIWKKSDGQSITIDYQHAFLGMTFEGKLVDANTLRGEARNRQGDKWTWTAKRLSEDSDQIKAHSNPPPKRAPADKTKNGPSAASKRARSAINNNPSTPPSKKSETLLRAESGDPNAQFSIGLEHFKKRQLDEARKWFEKSAEQGFAPAKAFLERIK